MRIGAAGRRERIRRLEPSLSVNKNVTVPDGNSLTTTPDGPQPEDQR